MDREAADKLANKGSASSQSDYKIDTVTRSKAPMMEQKIEIPETLYACINLALEAKQKLKTCTSDESLLKQLNYYNEQIGGLAGFYKEMGHLPSDWEYDPDTASSYVPKCHLVSAEKKTKKNIPRNPHIDSAPLVGEPAKAKAAPFKYIKLDKKFKADKLAKNHSASSQSDYQKIDRVTPSKEPLREFEIPETVYFYVKLALKAEQELKTRSSDECLLQELNGYEEEIASVAKLFIAAGRLPVDWKYNPDIANSYVPVYCPIKPAKMKIKMDIPRNPHIDTVPLNFKRAKAVWRKFKKLDETFNKTTRIGLTFDENNFTRVAESHEFVTFICNFAVRVFNESCQMYRNNNIKSITKAKVQECKYAKVRPCYLFYMTIEAVEQGKSGAYEINLRCNLDDGAIVLDSFCLKGTSEAAIISLNSKYETVKDDSSSDPEVYYFKSGMVRRTGGYDYFNPCGWDRLEKWVDNWDEERDGCF